MRYFLELAYDGGEFCGWQRQPNAPSVQQRIEESLSTILRTPTPVTGAGRTDTGVHASQMYAHFDVEQPIHDNSRFLRSLDFMCGNSIAIRRLIPVAAEAHARFDATARTYKYLLSTRKDPFMRNLGWHCPYSLDFEKMNQAASRLLQVSDFTSFAKLHTDNKTNICKVTEAHWDRIGPHLWVFTITADRFLRNMVRAIVGTLVDVGRGKITLEQFDRIIASKNRGNAGTSMPPQALYLHEVKYPYITAEQEK